MTGQRDDRRTSSLLHDVYFKNYYKMITIDWTKQQTLDVDPEAIQPINFTGNIDRARKTTMFFIIEEVKEATLDFSQETVRVLRIYFILI